MLNKSAFLTVKRHNPENLVFQHLPIKEKIKNPYKNNRLEHNIRRRESIIVDTWISVDIVETIKFIVFEVFEGFFCHNLEYNHDTEFVTDMFEKKEIHLSYKEKIYFKKT